MGGSAFSSLPDPPFTPRMPGNVYRHMVAACGNALRELFLCVATPIEGPGKRDYGDIDMLVALEKRVIFPKAGENATPRTPHELMSAIRSILHAEYAIIHPTGVSANLAIPWPSNLGELVDEPGAEPDTEEQDANTDDGEKAKFIQVDVRICPDVHRLCWILYKHAHGDLWNLIGSTIRPYGLTVDEEALWLRIPEIEPFNRKMSKVQLTTDPADILHFFGMKVDGYWEKPFNSVDELFEYATSCRFFQVQETPEGDPDEAGTIGGEEGRKKLKANDRRRMGQREVYRRWINEYIPSLRAQGKFLRRSGHTSIVEARAAVRDEAFARFHVGPEYHMRLREFRLKRDSEQMKAFIKELIPTGMDPHRRSCLVSAMIKILMEDDTSFGPVPVGHRDAEGFYNKEVARSFIQSNMAEVEKAAWGRQLERAREAMQRKALKAAGETTTREGQS